MQSVKFYFDPGCPWTWLSSRWLVRVAELEGFDIEWRSFSLPYAKKEEMPASTAAHRVIQTRRDRGDNDGIARFYEELGTRIHVDGEEPTVDLVREVAEADDGVDDDTLDAKVAFSTEEALCLAGPDIGSPVLSLGEERFSLFGPIIDAVPDDEGSLRLWSAVQQVATVPEYHELKRGRRQKAQVRN